MSASRRRVVPALAVVSALLLGLSLLSASRVSSAAERTSPLVAAAPPAALSTAWNPAEACAKLVSAPVEQLEGAPTRVSAAGVVPAAGGLPEYCRVTGYVASQIQFELRLPTTSWNGSYYQTGCGGLCGNVPINSCNTALTRNFAVAAENTGHVSTSHDALWAYGDSAAKADFGYRSPHVVSIAGKALTRLYYGRAPERALFEGCSNGGRQGISLATRYPTDFDGIIVRDPALHGPQAGMFYMWVARANHRADGTVILPADKLPLVHQAALGACDDRDGQADGMISDPSTCDWDPGELECSAERPAGSCLTTEQVRVVRAFYSGPTGSHGRELYPVNSRLRGLQVGALARGSELEWANPAFDLISRTPGRPSAAETLAAGFYRYLVFRRDPGPKGDYREFDYDRDPALLDNRFIGTGSVDLAAFHKAGGRLLMIQDLADQAIPATSTTTYYDEAVSKNGGSGRTNTWLRLFTVPGTSHCNALSSAPGVIDALSVMEKWVKENTPPETLSARQLNSSGQVIAERTLYPYPNTGR